MFLRAIGGTESAFDEIFKQRLPNFKYSISVSEVNKKRDILWMHQSYDQPSVQNLKYTQTNFKKIVCVSNWQLEMFVKYLGIERSKCVVISNGINPLPIYDKPADCINLVYSSTPFRGLDVLIEAFVELKMENVFLHVFSSMKIYDRSDDDYQDLYAKIKRVKNTRYWGAVPSAFLQTWIARYGHILTYPCTFEETFCCAVREAMSARCLVIAPNLGALFETNPFCINYDNFLDKLKQVIVNYPEYANTYLDAQKEFADERSWDVKAREWMKLSDQLDLEN